MNDKRKNNEVDCFMWYMFNDWNITEAKAIFGSKSGFLQGSDNLAQHIYNKWRESRERHRGDLWWYSELDRRCQQAVVNRAKIKYLYQ